MNADRSVIPAIGIGRQAFQFQVLNLMQVRICALKIAISPILAVTTLLAIAMPAMTQTLDCNNAMSQTDMNACAIQDFEKADNDLNESYKKVSGKLKGRTLELLKQSQRAWLMFRDAECEFRSEHTLGGQVNRMVVSGCMAFLTNERAKHMEYYLTCEEGDISCPTWSTP